MMAAARIGGAVADSRIAVVLLATATAHFRWRCSPEERTYRATDNSGAFFEVIATIVSVTKSLDCPVQIPSRRCWLTRKDRALSLSQ